MKKSGFTGLSHLMLTSFLVTALPSGVLAQDGASVLLDQVTLSADGAQGYAARRSTAGTKTDTPLDETPA